MAELAAIEAESAQLKLLHIEQQKREDEMRSRMNQNEQDDNIVLSIDVPMLAMREVCQ